jgi:hypothetical protein
MGCHTQTGFGLMRLDFPDGLPFIEQPGIVIEMFDVITWAINKEQEDRATRGQ